MGTSLEGSRKSYFSGLVMKINELPTPCFVIDETKLIHNLEILKEHTDAIGKISTTKKEIFIATKDGVLKIVSLQFPGKKRMLAHELLNGISFSENAMAL